MYGPEALPPRRQSTGRSSRPEEQANSLLPALWSEVELSHYPEVVLGAQGVPKFLLGKKTRKDMD